MEKLHRLKSYMVGIPVSPAHWFEDPEYEEWLEVIVTAGGGMGGSLWYEYIHPQELPSNKIIAVENIEGHTIQLNTAYIVKAEPVRIVFATYWSDNPNYQRGIYVVRWVTPYDEHEFVNQYINGSAPDRGEPIK